jgi:hypothetical protein
VDRRRSSPLIVGQPNSKQYWAARRETTHPDDLSKFRSSEYQMAFTVARHSKSVATSPGIDRRRQALCACCELVSGEAVTA